MNHLEEADRIDKAIKDAQIRLKSIETNLEQIDKEINILAPRKIELETNLEFHKKSGTIPIAHEYKKSKAELSKVKGRLIFITSERKKTYDACKQVGEVIDKLKRDQTELLRKSEDNVLRVVFGGKSGKR